MNFIDYYKVLGINKSATVSDIKKAYRKQASKYHPDLNPNDADANKNFQQINEANEVLSDPDKRKKYDKYGKDWQHAEQFENAKQYQEQASDSRGQKYSRAQSGGDFSDFFESMFGCRQPKKVQLEDMMLGMVFMISLTWGNSTRKDLFEPGMEHVMSTWPA